MIYLKNKVVSSLKFFLDFTIQKFFSYFQKAINTIFIFDQIILLIL